MQTLLISNQTRSIQATWRKRKHVNERTGTTDRTKPSLRLIIALANKHLYHLAAFIRHEKHWEIPAIARTSWNDMCSLGCMCVWEREREIVCVCVCVCVWWRWEFRVVYVLYYLICFTPQCIRWVLSVHLKGGPWANWMSPTPWVSQFQRTPAFSHHSPDSLCA